jgi:hypothetical protein
LSTHGCIFQVECLSIMDDSAVPDMALGEHSRHSSKQARAVHFQNDAADGETDPSLAQASMLSRFFCTWRFNSRQQFRMQMVRCLNRFDFVIEANISL